MLQATSIIRIETEAFTELNALVSIYFEDGTITTEQMAYWMAEVLEVTYNR